MVEPAVAGVLLAWVGMYLGSEGKRVHLYGGAAAMRDGVKPLQ